MKITPTKESICQEYYGITFELARTGSKTFNRKWHKLKKPHQRQIDSNNISPDKLLDLMCEALAGTVLTGWAGEFPDGKEYPYSDEMAKQLLVDDDEFRDWVVKSAGDLEMFLDDAAEYFEKKY